MVWPRPLGLKQSMRRQARSQPSEDSMAMPVHVETAPCNAPSEWNENGHENAFSDGRPEAAVEAAFME